MKIGSRLRKKNGSVVCYNEFESATLKGTLAGSKGSLEMLSLLAIAASLSLHLPPGVPPKPAVGVQPSVQASRGLRGYLPVMFSASKSVLNW